jgi:hypothetical protein
MKGTEYQDRKPRWKEMIRQDDVNVSHESNFVIPF